MASEQEWLFESEDEQASGQFSLKLTDGAHLVEFSGAVTGGVPRSPESGGMSATDTWELVWTGGAVETVQEAMFLTKRLLQQARDRWGTARTHPVMSHHAPVYAMLREGPGATEEWRSEVFDGRLDWGEDALRAWALGMVGESLHVRLTLIVEHRPWWEGALTELPLSNANGTHITGGLTVWNHSDSDEGHQHFVDIDHFYVTGDQDAPVKVAIEKLGVDGFGDAARESYFLAIGNTIDARTGHQFQGEYGTDQTGSGSSQDVGNAYWGGQGYFLLPVNGASLTELMRWTPPNSYFASWAGARFRFVLRIAPASVTQTLWLQLRIRSSSVVETLWEGPLVRVAAGGGAELLDMGMTNLPATLYGMPKVYQQHIQVWGRHDGAAGQVGIDYLNIWPLDGYLEAQAITTVPEGLRLVLDGIEQKRYVERVSDGFVQGGVVGSGRLMLRPGRHNRLYVLWADENGDASANGTSKARMWYRPRRSGL